MALLIVHLYAALEWAKRHPRYLEDPDFYLGAVSPDAIHVRDHDDKSHKNEVHLNNWQSPHPDDVLSYWRDRHAAFDIGYGIHVLTDGQWVVRYREQLRGLFRSDGTLDVSAYYHDCLITDYALYNADGRGSMLVSLVERGTPPADHPLLTFDEFSEWRRTMIEAYRGGCREKGAARWIDRPYVDRFLKDCQPLMDETWNTLTEQVTDLI